MIQGSTVVSEMAQAADRVHPVRIGIAGVSGYGHHLLSGLAQHGDNSLLNLTAVYEAFPEKVGHVLDDLRSQGVRVHNTFESFINDGALEAVWLPVPLHLHAQMTEQALEAGRSVMCEKPAAVTLAEVDRMIDARDRSGKQVLVGFQEIYSPSTRRMKSLLLSGELGAIQRVSVLGSWPRPAEYFARNNWAGKREVDGHPVHDSPLSNAMAHFVNLALFFAGTSLNNSANPEQIEDAKLCRANPIDNYDTVTCKVQLDSDVEFSVWLTHAAKQDVDPVIRVQCEQGYITRSIQEVTIHRAGANPVSMPTEGRDTLWMFRDLAHQVRGVENSLSVTASLEIARCHTALIEALAQLPVQDFPVGSVKVHEDGDRSFRVVPGLVEGFYREEREWIAPPATH